MPKKIYLQKKSYINIGRFEILALFYSGLLLFAFTFTIAFFEKHWKFVRDILVAMDSLFRSPCEI